MINLRVVGISIVVSAAFGSTSCLAQMVNSFSSAPPIPVASTLQRTHPAQVERCQDFGRYVNLVASARDAGESRQELSSRLGLNMQRGRIAEYQSRLPPHTLAAGGTSLVKQIYASNYSPATWQKTMLTDCERKIIG